MRQGVKWHDGKPFTSADVKCTFDMLMGKSPQKFRQNPRKSWYEQVDDVTTNGDYEASFHLKRPQPALLALLASGYTPVYPCHVSPADMRTHPIGTGPFKFVEFKANESIKLVRNPDYWKKGLPHLDGIEFTIIPNRSTAILGFIVGQVRHDVPDRGDDPAAQGRQGAGAERDLRGRADQRLAPTSSSIRRRRRSTIRISAARMALALDRKAFISILFEGQADIGGTMLPAPGRAVGDAEGDAGDDPGLRPRRQRQPRRSAQADAEGGLRARQAPRSQGLDPQHRRSTAIPR